MSATTALLARLRADDGNLGNGSDDTQIAATSSTLDAAGLPAIPEAYAALLREADGVFHDALTLFGVTPLAPPEPAGAALPIPDLVTANGTIGGAVPRPADSLLIGLADEAILVWWQSEMVYLLLDRTDGTEIDRDAALVPLLNRLVDED